MLRPFARVLGVDGTGGKLRHGSSVQGRAGHGGLRSDHGQKIRPGAECLLEEIDGRPPLPARLEAQGLKEVSALRGGTDGRNGGVFASMARGGVVAKIERRLQRSDSPGRDENIMNGEDIMRNHSPCVG